MVPLPETKMFLCFKTKASVKIIGGACAPLRPPPPPLASATVCCFLFIGRYTVDVIMW